MGMPDSSTSSDAPLVGPDCDRAIDGDAAEAKGRTQQRSVEPSLGRTIPEIPPQQVKDGCCRPVAVKVSLKAKEFHGERFLYEKSLDEKAAVANVLGFFTAPAEVDDEGKECQPVHYCMVMDLLCTTLKDHADSFKGCEVKLRTLARVLLTSLAAVHP